MDVEDGKPPLKLAYNKGEDPYMAAHNFLMKYDLPPSYLDQVIGIKIYEIKIMLKINNRLQILY